MLTSFTEIGHEKAQSVIDSITSSYAAEGQAGANPMLHSNPGVGRGFPLPFPGGGMPPMGPNGMPLPFPPPGGFPGGMMPPPGDLPFPPPGGFPAGMTMPPNGMPFPPPGGFPPPGVNGMPPMPPNFQFPPQGGAPPGGFPQFPPQGGFNMPPQGPPEQQGRDPRLQGRDAYSDRR